MDADFTRIFELYNADIYRLIYSYTLDLAESKDILQETFIKLYKNFEKLPKDDVQIKRWLMKVASNQSKDYLKSFWHRHFKSLSNENFDLCIEESAKETLKTLAKINKKFRIPLYLHYYEGYDISEIASILDLSESAVKMRLSRAKKEIKKEMERY